MLKVKEFRDTFSLSGLATAIFLGLAPSAWDTGSDFAFAKVLWGQFFPERKTREANPCCRMRKSTSEPVADTTVPLRRSIVLRQR